MSLILRSVQIPKKVRFFTDDSLVVFYQYLLSKSALKAYFGNMDLILVGLSFAVLSLNMNNWFSSLV